MSKSKSKADIAIAKLIDRLKATPIGLWLRALGVDSTSVDNYMRSHKDVEEAVDLWLQDLKSLIKEEGDG